MYMLYFIPNDVELFLDENNKNTLGISNNKKIDENFNKKLPEKIPEKISEKIHKKSKKRCNLTVCRKKLKLTDLVCNCGFRFCSNHRLPELHSCTQNFKEKNREKYLKKVILGGGEVIKIDKI